MTSHISVRAVSKAFELLVNSYVKLKERKALQHLLNGWQNTYRDLERRSSSTNILETLAQEIEMIKDALESLGDGDNSLKKPQPSDVKVLGIGVSVSPTTTVNEGSSPQAHQSTKTTPVVVTGLSIAVSRSSPGKQPSDDLK